MNPFLQECKVTRVANAAVAAQTGVTSDVLDMTGFDGVVFIALLGDVTATSVLTLTAYEHTASAAAGTAVSSGATAAVTAGASDCDNKVLAVDVVRPSKQYVYAILTRTVANAVVDGILAIRYKGRVAPVVNSDLLASAFAIAA